MNGMEEKRPTTADRRISILRGLVCFACACLISIVVLEYSALLGLALAALGGIGLGILIVRGQSA
jgi:hypothetical protein